MSVQDWWRTLQELWSTTHFEGADRSRYAQRLMLLETRNGLRALCVGLVVPLLLLLALSPRMALSNHFVWTAVPIVALCVHVFFSARVAKDLRTLNTLAVTLLVVSASGFVLLMHRSADLGTVLSASIVLLFMLIPMMPWGLREGSLALVLVYAMVTVSTLQAAQRFENSALWALQGVLLAAGGLGLALVARGTYVRRKDISARFALDLARADALRQSLEDPLTSAWNRRYLEHEFDGFVADAEKRGEQAHLAVIDVDIFKALNDQLGHGEGDRVLQEIADRFQGATAESGFVVRLGGDEFAVLWAGSEATEFVERAVSERDPITDSSGSPVGLSVGVVSIPTALHNPILGQILGAADRALYRAKQRARVEPGAVTLCVEELVEAGETS